ncbi:MAG: ferritin [Anaerovoracaceae bacterium]|nr:ferritin [Anaerovoracaceae bacterium]
MNEKLVRLINDQINAELYSAYLYLDFSNYYYERGLDGFANWYDVQTQEEIDHAMLMRKYLHNNGEKVVFSEIRKPDIKLKNDLDPLEAALKHEQYVTSLINKLYKAAADEDDFRTMQFLDWFVKEQCEEEENAEGMIRKYGLFGSDPKGLFELNKELLERKHSAPSLKL